MNHVSLQIVTWGMVCSAIAAAVLLAVHGDAMVRARADALPEQPLAGTAAPSPVSAKVAGPKLAERGAERLMPTHVSLQPRPVRLETPGGS